MCACHIVLHGSGVMCSINLNLKNILLLCETPDNHNKYEKKNAWKEIGNLMAITVFDHEEKMKSLMDT